MLPELVLADWLEELAVHGPARRPQEAETAHHLSKAGRRRIARLCSHRWQSTNLVELTYPPLYDQVCSHCGARRIGPNWTGRGESPERRLGAPRAKRRSVTLADWLEELAVYGTARNPLDLEIAHQLSLAIEPRRKHGEISEH
jgi:NMD protein affecting ribosome stability and mRNA decay